MNRKIKILQINSIVQYGSTGRIVEDLAEAITDMGWESSIAFARGVSKSHSNMIKIGNRWDITAHGLQTRLFDGHGLASRRSTIEFLKKLSSLKPDIVHLHNLHGYYLNYPLLFQYLLETKIPIVWTLHDCWAFTGHCSYFEMAACDKWKKKCFSCPQTNEYPASWFFDRSQNNFKMKQSTFSSAEKLVIVPVSYWLSGLVEESFLKKHERTVISNGVDMEKFYPRKENRIRQEYKNVGKKVLIGVASEWGARKGLRDYYKLIQELGSEYVILLVGLSRYENRNAPTGIIAIDRTDSIDHLAELYSCADIVLNLSYEETFGLTTVEGMACGTPGIVYNSTASPELITKETGIIVEPGNIGELAKSVEKILIRGKRSYSGDCIEHVKNKYNKKDRYMDYMNLYRGLV